MLSVVNSAALYGIEAYSLGVEVDVSRGVPAFNLVGLPDTAVRESRERVEAAIKNSGYNYPSDRITVNLTPANVKKEGSSLDLPIATAILSASGTVQKKHIEDFILIGELSLNGNVRPVKGVLAMAMLAEENDKRGVLVPPENAKEAAVVEGIEVYPVETLSHAVSFINDEIEIEKERVDLEEVYKEAKEYDLDFKDVKGHPHAKRALEVAASGGHNVLAVGPPGSGKTMLARRLPSILPDLSVRESLETTRIHSIAGTLDSGSSLLSVRPFRSPHHTISSAGLIGGGTIPAPGEVSLAHNGVLFLDELPEFQRNVLESMRQPLEDGNVTIARSARTVSFPSSFSLIASMNPCPCGYYGSSLKECTCTPGIINRYRSKISGPLMDRIDIHIEVPALKFREMEKKASGEPSADIRERVMKARDIQEKRFEDSAIENNAGMGQEQLREYCDVGSDSKTLMESAINRLGLSARAYDRILKVGRTVADLEGSEEIKSHHISEAIQYRTFDKTIR